MIPRSPRTGLPIIPKRPPAPSVRCADSPSPALLAAIAQFNAGDYWHCHETLEALWRGEPDAIRSLYQGILLVAVGLYHRERGNQRGAAIKFRQALERLAPFTPTCMCIDVSALRGIAEGELRRLDAAAGGERLVPPGAPVIAVAK